MSVFLLPVHLILCFIIFSVSSFYFYLHFLVCYSLPHSLPATFLPPLVFQIIPLFVCYIRPHCRPSPFYLILCSKTLSVSSFYLSLYFFSCVLYSFTVSTFTFLLPLVFQIIYTFVCYSLPHCLPSPFYLILCFRSYLYLCDIFFHSVFLHLSTSSVFQIISIFVCYILPHCLPSFTFLPHLVLQIMPIFVCHILPKCLPSPFYFLLSFKSYLYLCVIFFHTVFLHLSTSSCVTDHITFFLPAVHPLSQFLLQVVSSCLKFIRVTACQETGLIQSTFISSFSASTHVQWRCRDALHCAPLFTPSVVLLSL